MEIENKNKNEKYVIRRRPFPLINFKAKFNGELIMFMMSNLINISGDIYVNNNGML